MPEYTLSEINEMSLIKGRIFDGSEELFVNDSRLGGDCFVGTSDDWDEEFESGPCWRENYQEQKFKHGYENMSWEEYKNEILFNCLESVDVVQED